MQYRRYDLPDIQFALAWCFPMHLGPRCGAYIRGDTPCMTPAVKGKRRCRLHGGADGSGVPKGNKNALKH